MRFIISVILFGVAAVMVAAGILIHSVFHPPTTTVSTLRLKDPAPIVVIDTSSLDHISSTQVISIKGGASGTVYVNNAGSIPTATQASSGHIVLAWGRESDVLAYIGNVSYQSVNASGQNGRLVVKTITGTETSTPNPFDSDLWVERYEGDEYLSQQVTTPRGNLLVIATDGALPAPSVITVTWKMDIDRSIPTNLFYGGLALAIVGAVFFYLGWLSDRRKRRHRQGRMPRPPRPQRWKPDRSGLGPRRRGRRALPFVAVGMALPLALTGCTVFPSITNEPLPTSTPSPRGVAVTAPQFARILGEVIATLKTADEQRAENIAATRCDGAALRFRAAQYKVNTQSKTLGIPFEIPNGTVRLLLPQKTTTWPRSVFAVIDDTEHPKNPSVAVVMTQQTPRDNYKINYSVALEPGAQIPSVPSADSGAAVIYGDTELLSVTPSQAIEHYGDLLIQGKDSAFVNSFEADSLQKQIGRDAKDKRAKDLGKTAKFAWTDIPTEDTPVVFAAAEGGALVAVTLQENEKVTPATAGAAITSSGAVKILAGVTSSMKGIEASYQYQLLFYVPALSSQEKIQLLGYSYALTSAHKLGK